MIASQCGMLEVVRTLLRFNARVDVFDEVMVFIELHFSLHQDYEPYEYLAF